MGSLSLDKIKVMEIINDPTYGSSEEAYEMALKAWTLMLNDGYKTVAIGGSDSHNIPQESYEQSAYPSLIGDPKTWIYSDGLSKASLKESLLAGRVCVSREDVIDLKHEGERFRVKCARTYYHKERLKILWVANGEVVKESFSNEDELILEPTNDYGWIRVDIRTESGYLFGFTNPIFINEEKKPDHKLLAWQDVMDRMND